jgi:hypothetical protein
VLRGDRLRRVASSDCSFILRRLAASPAAWDFARLRRASCSFVCSFREPVIPVLAIFAAQRIGAAVTFERQQR